MNSPIRFILACIFILASALSLMAQPYRDPDEAKFTVRNAESLNSSDDDYAPATTANGEWLYITSSRDGTSHIYRSRRESSGWGMPVKVDDAGVNSSAKGDGALSLPVPMLARLLRLDGDLLARANPTSLGVMTSAKRSDGAGDADVYVVRVATDGASLQDVRPLPELNSSEWDSQPAIAPDGSYIIFSSTREGGLGDKDLYISTRGSDGRYSAPTNLGSAINSSSNDVAPYITPDGRTLFFASDGRGGFGGSDIFTSRRNTSGQWSDARNLGDRINTSANELFFVGASRERCYFVSDRSEGRGGFDVYEGTPNIFAPGYATLQLVIRDTVKGSGLGGRVKVVEGSLGRTIGEYDVDADGIEIPVLSGYAYRIEVTPNGFPATTLTLADFSEETTVRRTINVGRAVAPPSRPEAPLFTCTFEAKDIPMFISGYYRLNTIASLDDLRKRQASGELSAQTYIADVSNNRALYDQYRRLAQEVEKVVKECGSVSLEKYFPEYIAFQKARNVDEQLEITVRAYSDPRPISGIYAEGRVTFFDEGGREYSIAPGDSLDNFKLAGLRAYYAKEYLDGVFSRTGTEGSRQYLDLVNRGVIRWRPVSGGVDESAGSNDINANRRIKVEFRRVAR